MICAHHRLARREARLVVAAERVLDDVDQAPVAVGARLVGAGPGRAANTCTRSLLATSGRATLTASQSPRSIAPARSPTRSGSRRCRSPARSPPALIARASGRFLPSISSAGPAARFHARARDLPDAPVEQQEVGERALAARDHRVVAAWPDPRPAGPSPPGCADAGRSCRSTRGWRRRRPRPATCTPGPTPPACCPTARC